VSELLRHHKITENCKKEYTDVASAVDGMVQSQDQYMLKTPSSQMQEGLDLSEKLKQIYSDVLNIETERYVKIDAIDLVNSFSMVIWIKSLKSKEEHWMNILIYFTWSK
jgi:hypothetical protein